LDTVADRLGIAPRFGASGSSVYIRLVGEELSYTVYKEGTEQAFPLRKEMILSDISEYNILVISKKLYGEALFSSIAAAVTAALTVVPYAVTTSAIIAGYAVAAIVVIGLVVALGYLMQALSPNKKIDNNTDASEASRIFNGVPNIIEQGGGVPVVVGNCLFGGVRIGLKFEPAAQAYTDTISVANFTAAMSYPSTWLKLT